MDNATERTQGHNEVNHIQVIVLRDEHALIFPVMFDDREPPKSGAEVSHLGYDDFTPAESEHIANAIASRDYVTYKSCETWEQGAEVLRTLSEELKSRTPLYEKLDGQVYNKPMKFFEPPKEQKQQTTKTAHRASFTTEQIQSARTASLADYFNRNNYECTRHGDEIHVKGFQGLWINPQKGTWYSFGTNEGDYNSINCLQKVLGRDFQTAVGELTGEQPLTQTAGQVLPAKREYTPAVKEVKNFAAPERADNVKRIYAYLINRGIDKEMLSQLISDKSLYQDKMGNAVFVHKNEKGEAVGAELHGTCTYKSFQGVAAGTSGTVFEMTIGVPTKAYVFESAIDLMSFYKMADKEKLQNCTLISMGGLKPEALKPFQEKGIKILSCVDNDEAGIKFNAKHGFSGSPKLAQEGVKDRNDLLQKRMGINQFANLAPQKTETAARTKTQTADMVKQDKIAQPEKTQKPTKPTKPKHGSHH